MTTAPRFRFSESAAIRKHVLRVPTELVEHLVNRAADSAAAGVRWLQAADLVTMSDTLKVEGQRLMGMYVYMDEAGTVTEIGLARAGALH
ncbi:hypothetical protein IGB42_00386 [Andreprevotia sp. IGB-42]|uniref:hypothetical protein n=1 Tax=Andreprevotia sp. IGB-42 TaxID=2497473 RepID=UPI0013592533|nr:hypothetical protein [Andreprevotia sp. IGB-42]KAF0815305.1 hypothetical protein IGB42_00386 [Andreprevotia sp. IGB-42]